MFENCFFSHHLFPVFQDSGFTRTLCGGKWQSLSSNSYLTSTGRLGCCSPGQFMASSTSTVCDACPSGQYGSTVDDDITSCNDCGMGKYGELDGQNSSSACQDCGMGTYGDQTGQSSESTACTNCGTGKYNNQTGQEVCQVCGPGYVSGIGSMNCAQLSGQVTAAQLRAAYDKLNLC